MLLPDLMKSLNAFETHFPTILGHRVEGIELRLSPDETGHFEASLATDGSPASIRAGSQYRYCQFDSISELESLLNNPSEAKWHSTPIREEAEVK